MNTTQEDKRIAQSYEILDRLRLDNDLYRASLSSEYNFIWLRDSFYCSLPYLNNNSGYYTKSCHAILDILKRYKWKLKIHTKQKPIYTYEYIHPRYTIDGFEVNAEWGNAQNDSYAAILWMIAEGIKSGKKIIRDSEDLEVIQLVVDFINCIEYWHDHDNSLWEEEREIHSSSIGACVSALISIKDIVNVPNEMIRKGVNALKNLLPRESTTKDVDAAQLSLIYPFNVTDSKMAKTIINNVETQLLRPKGCIRYKFDSYHSTLVNGEEGRYQQPKEIYSHTEMQWTMFIPWLALCHLELGNIKKAKQYIEMTETLFDENGYLPEGYKADGTPCPNNPLGWSHSLYILSVEEYEKQTKG